MKRYMRHENKVNENKVLSFCKALRCETIEKITTKLFSFMSNLHTYYHFKSRSWYYIQHDINKGKIWYHIQHNINQR